MSTKIQVGILIYLIEPQPSLIKPSPFGDTEVDMQSNRGVDLHGARFGSTAVVFTFFGPMRELNVRNDSKTFHAKHVCTHRGASLALGAVELH